MSKDVLIGAVVLLLALAGIVWFAFSRPAAPASPSTSYSGEVSEESEYYSIDARYPTTTPLRASAGAAADQAAVEVLKADGEDGVQNFKQATDPSQIPDATKQAMGLGAGRKFSLTISYQATSTPAAVSYILTADEDALGAHPNTDFLTETFDAHGGKRLALADLFAQGADYLHALASTTAALLPAKIAQAEGVPVSQVDTSLLEAGTAPEDASFGAWYLADHDLVIIFPPYQVAPYAAGPQIVSIPTSILASILKPEYQ